MKSDINLPLVLSDDLMVVCFEPGQVGDLSYLSAVFPTVFSDAERVAVAEEQNCLVVRLSRRSVAHCIKVLGDIVSDSGVRPSNVVWWDRVYTLSGAQGPIVIPTGLVKVTFDIDTSNDFKNEILTRAKGTTALTPSEDAAVWIVKPKEETGLSPSDLSHALNSDPDAKAEDTRVLSAEVLTHVLAGEERGIFSDRTAAASIVRQCRRRAIVLRRYSMAMILGIPAVLAGSVYLFFTAANYTATADIIGNLTSRTETIASEADQVIKQIQEVAQQNEDRLSADLILPPIRDRINGLIEARFIERRAFLNLTEFGNEGVPKPSYDFTPPRQNWDYRNAVVADITGDGNSEVVLHYSYYSCRDTLLDETYPIEISVFPDPVLPTTERKVDVSGISGNLCQLSALDLEGDGDSDLVLSMAVESDEGIASQFVVLPLNPDGTRQGPVIRNTVSETETPGNIQNFRSFSVDIDDDDQRELIIWMPTEDRLKVVELEVSESGLETNVSSIFGRNNRLIDLAVVKLTRFTAPTLVALTETGLLQILQFNPTSLTALQINSAIQPPFPLDDSQGRNSSKMVVLPGASGTDDTLLIFNSQAPSIFFLDMEDKQLKPVGIESFDGRNQTDRFSTRSVSVANVNNDSIPDLLAITDVNTLVPLIGLESTSSLRYRIERERTVPGSLILGTGRFNDAETSSVVSFASTTNTSVGDERFQKPIEDAFVNGARAARNQLKSALVCEPELELLSNSLQNVRADFLKIRDEQFNVVTLLPGATDDANAKVTEAAIDLETQKLNLTFLQQSSLRFGVVVVMFFLVQILVVTYRYTLKLAYFFDARADALELSQDMTLEEFDGLVKSQSPEHMDFGKAPASPTDQLTQIAKSLATKIPTR